MVVTVWLLSDGVVGCCDGDSNFVWSWLVRRRRWGAVISAVDAIERVRSEHEVKILAVLTFHIEALRAEVEAR